MWSRSGVTSENSVTLQKLPCRNTKSELQRKVTWKQKHALNPFLRNPQTQLSSTTLFEDEEHITSAGKYLYIYMKLLQF